ncbi:tyrosine-protein kinase Srms [Capsaspora owczarzaki ATCC 30864]|uniref:tyrosine-protein kinase Srms n=1 Tax=Capsaspora owczarzaki (strain ATCC 30864) TaxID=595528 RepID=UPI00035260ED|nr:tyrosine-protein kinase Srms [Capsaspora owczarzaki ATCC 30864]|eukprot:XP_004364338.2 tyrosine-protein kinase Srms [Capsaspora owczarzaki ATCC 30864]
MYRPLPFEPMANMRDACWTGRFRRDVVALLWVLLFLNLADAASGQENACNKSFAAQLHKFQSTFRQIQHHYRLNLQDNQITQLAAGSFAGLYSLSRLTLDNSAITTLDSQAFDGLTALYQFSSLSMISTLTFSGMPALRVLFLSNNAITAIPAGAFYSLSRLDFLDLSYNAITAIAAGAFSGLSQLGSLNLANNQLTTLPPGLFQGMGSVWSIALSSNNFTFGGNSLAPPSTYGSASDPIPCDAACATCFDAGASSCCPAFCLRCSSASTCTICYDGYVLNGAACVATAATNMTLSVASQSAASATSVRFLASLASVASVTSVAPFVSSASVASAKSAASASSVSAVSVSSVSVKSVNSQFVSTLPVLTQPALSSTSAIVPPAVSTTPSSSHSGDSPATNSNHSSDSNTPLVIGLIVNSVVLLIVIIVLIVMVVRRRNQNQLFQDKPSARFAYDAERDLLPMTSVTIPAASDAHVPASAFSATYQAQASDRLAPLVATEHLRDALTLDKTLGSGAFGVVVLGHLPRDLVPSSARHLLQEPSQQVLDVAVKCLQPNATEKSRIEFVEEARMVARLNHPNIIQSIAALLDAEPYMNVLELMPHGDLRELLKKSSAATLQWTRGEFAHVLGQVAGALSYLESIRFVHRDIAARNCLVGPGLTVKLADFGLSRTLAEESDYYRMESKGRLPVKWMAPECLNFRKFTHQSDVWAFGVLAWEVYSYGAVPYGQLKGPEVLTQILGGQRLAKPSACTPEDYKRLLLCWELDPHSRSSPSQLHEYFAGISANQTVRDIGALITRS